MNFRKKARARLASRTSLVGLAIALQHAAAPGAFAQTPAVAEAEEVVITGTRLQTGFDTPTPVTMMTAESLAQSAPGNVIDALRQLPALANSNSNNTTSPGTTTAGNHGQSNINMRNLGIVRNLVLLDGRRSVASNVGGAVDLNVLPQNLVSRIDIVTGGASAAYGSDAVSGVTNLILDTDFVGLKGEIGGGISDYGDLPLYKGSLAWGGAFAGERLHIIASTQYFKQKGTFVGETSGRAWWDKPCGLINNRTGSGPGFITVCDLTRANATNGGLITNGPLKGTQFLKGGAPGPFQLGYSAVLGDNNMGGGDGGFSGFNFFPDTWRTVNFAHAEYDVNDSTTVFAELSFSYARVLDPTQFGLQLGPFNYTIYSGNPFLPASIQSAMTANNITSFTMGRVLTEAQAGLLSNTRLFRQAVGIEGKFGSGEWGYDAYYSHGRTNQLLNQYGLTKKRESFAAADAVVHPTTGQIVCRSNWYNGNTFVPGGTGLDPGCKPMNLFGVGSVAPETVPWIVGDSWRKVTLDQDVVQFNINGTLGENFSFEAGPIAVATGLEYRSEKGVAVTDLYSTQNATGAGLRGFPASLEGTLGGYRFFNPQPFGGKYNVKEGYVEIGVPLLRDVPLAQALNFNGAVRYTDYSTSGGVTTWKVGADYQVNPDLRFRGTVSRDIRAPNLLELYNAASQNTNNQIYPRSTSGVSTSNITIVSGNPNLKPERALTQTYGAVFTPTFLDGFSFSVDYYAIKLKDAIGTVGAQQTIDNCFDGIAGFCSLVTYLPAVPGVSAALITTRTPYLNLSVLNSNGFDIETTYNTALFDNPLRLNLLVNTITKQNSQAVNGPLLSTKGEGSNPKWRANLRINYAIGDAWSVLVQERFISKKLKDIQRVEGVSIDDNDVPAVFYTDLTINYEFEALNAANELYFTVNNVFNRAPPMDVGIPSSFAAPPNRIYDAIGRYYNLGVRFKF
ncbi:MAG: TonB-dependent receptor plug domain-containing protein [Rhodospirillaceae bacterium]